MKPSQKAGASSPGKRVLAAIRKDTIAGNLPAGSVLVQERHCEEYDVSRIPVRDTLVKLLHESFVTRNRRKQMVAARSSTRDVIGAFNIEALLCGFGARLPAHNLTEENLDGLDRLLREAEEAGDLPDEPIAVKASWEYLRRINRAAASSRLTSALRPTTIALTLDHTREAPAWSRKSRQQLRQILDALTAQDPQAAEDCMCEHSESARGFCADYLAKWARQRNASPTKGTQPSE